jgi:hypothetical protein
MTWQELCIFNWGTATPEDVNYHLYHEVGCRKPRGDYEPFDPFGNYHFSDEDQLFGTGKIRVPADAKPARSKNQVISFQSYAEQDEHKHGEADKIKGDGWKSVPGALDARDASAEILKMFVERRDVDELEAFLREKVYPFAPGCADKPAGGSAPPYEK